jgi:hypothetical protein
VPRENTVDEVSVRSEIAHDSKPARVALSSIHVIGRNLAPCRWLRPYREHMAAMALDYGGWAWDTDFNEISRPCLRRVELEVEMSLDDDDDWFARGTSEHALQTLALDADDLYPPDARARFPVPIMIGVGVAFVATVTQLWT